MVFLTRSGKNVCVRHFCLLNVFVDLFCVASILCGSVNVFALSRKTIALAVWMFLEFLFSLFFVFWVFWRFVIAQPQSHILN
jgi:hypothetical protein